MRVGLLTEGGYPYASGQARLWCDRLVHGLAQHEFEIYALSRSARQHAEEARGWAGLPPQVRSVRTAALWGEPPRPRASGCAGCAGRTRRTRAAASATYGRRERARFAEHFGDLASGISAPAGPAGPAGIAGTGGRGDQADRFASGLYGLAALAREHGGLPAALRSEHAVRALERACHTPGALRGAYQARVADLLAVAERLERLLRPLSLDWYGVGHGGEGGGGGCATAGGYGYAGGCGHVYGGPCGGACGGVQRGACGGSYGSAYGDAYGGGLAAVDLCHATSGGPAALPGLLAKRFFGTPLLVTEYGARLREHYLTYAAAPLSTPVRALMASFHRQLAAEVYAQAALITPGNTHTRRWQERCGADRDRLRTVYPGMDASRFTEVGEDGESAAAAEGGTDAADGGRTLLWTGRIEPGKDLIGLLHAFAHVRRTEPAARLRIVHTRTGFAGPAAAREARDYAAQCRALAAQLFPDEAADAVTPGENPVSFEELGAPEAPDLPEVYATAGVVLSSSVVEGFPVGLVEAMFCGRATVSTDVGAVCEVIGGTGLVVPPRNPRALADACLALLRDPGRRARLGAAARARALELFTVEQNIAAFGDIYLELMSHCPVRREEVGADGAPLPFARPAEAHVPGRWTAATPSRRLPGRTPADQTHTDHHTPSWAAAADRLARPPARTRTRAALGSGRPEERT
ncbi:DUF3492 domain-containing protein [Streptomyces sp. XD-27]|uniref:DUF3492 domain-containing protein n=1 Tax=Streptomyces sp. XD-27 TaxID=3062779 RepID=UPI0026F47770|nr:DUF3492 domain-containing protein [Streptomyces sp. XD-27]WKX72455.1 DUF3492 domain-containing protein [Streptomyces sp. XD-27]